VHGGGRRRGGTTSSDAEVATGDVFANEAEDYSATQLETCTRKGGKEDEKER
jgi:hypothetical protein